MVPIALHRIRRADGTPLPSSARTVYAVLAAHDGPGGCFPSIRVISAEAGLSRRSVFYALAQLVAVGVVEVTPRRRANGSRASSAYRLLAATAPRVAAGQRMVQPVAPLEHASSPSETKQRPAELIEVSLPRIVGMAAAELERATGRSPSERSRRLLGLAVALETRPVRIDAQAPGLAQEPLEGGKAMDEPRGPSPVESAALASAREKLRFGGAVDSWERIVCERFSGSLSEGERRILAAQADTPITDETRARLDALKQRMSSHRELPIIEDAAETDAAETDAADAAEAERDEGGGQARSA